MRNATSIMHRTPTGLATPVLRCGQVPFAVPYLTYLRSAGLPGPPGKLEAAHSVDDLSSPAVSASCIHPHPTSGAEDHGPSWIVGTWKPREKEILGRSCLACWSWTHCYLTAT